jgi:hypothetical protein
MTAGRPTAAARPWSRFALAAGLAAGCAAVVAVPRGRAQPSPGDAADPTPPLPAHDTKLQWQSKAGKYRFDTGDRAIFKRRDPKTGLLVERVEDDLPVASEKQNADEAAAWAEVVRHADQFPAAELERHAAGDLTPDDLSQPVRRAFRFELLRFDGQLVRFRRVAPTAAVAENGPAALYEGVLVPVDESPANPLRIVFTAPPDGLPAPPPPAAGEPAGEWVATDRWVRFAGYFFKYAAIPGPGADPADTRSAGWTRAPVLVGKSVSPLPGPPAEATDLALAARYRVFRMVRDDAAMSRDPAHWEEAAAWTRTLLHARKFPQAELEAAALRDVSFADLFVAGSRAEFQFKLIHVKGRLIRVRKFDATGRLAEAGVPAWYEAWVVPDNEPRGNPLCVVLSELPEGVEPALRLSRAVTLAAYSFKRVRYESAEPDPKDPRQHLWKAAPLLIGRGLTPAAETGGGPGEWVRWFIPVIVGGVVFLAGSAVLLTRWFRAGDRRMRAEFEAARVKNPFE